MATSLLPPSKKAKCAEVWKRDDGDEEVIDIEQEPRHHIDFVNEFTKIITIKMTPNDTTLAHRHNKDTIVVVLMEDGTSFSSSSSSWLNSLWQF